MNKRYRFICSTVKQAGKQLMSKTSFETKSKNNDLKDVVTSADVEISEFITSRIQKSFPSEIIYSEEAPIELSADSYWSIDPIDGSANFSRGIPHYAIVIAYIENGIPTAGAIYNPVTLELFSFQRDKGAFLNFKPVRVSKITDLTQAHVFIHIGRKPELWNWGISMQRHLLEKAKKTANFGSSALDICYVGAGRIEACIYGTMTTIDIAAAIGFVREAGGIADGVINNKKQKMIVVNNKDILEKLNI